MMTATSTKMPRLGNCDYSVIILSRSHPILLVKYTNNWIARSNVKVNTENERFTVVVKCGNFIMFFGTWQRTVLEGVPQVQRAHFSSFDQSHS